jgi:hypothetical protein
LATAKMMKKMPRGMMTAAEKNFRKSISRRNLGRRTGPARLPPCRPDREKSA